MAFNPFATAKVAASEVPAVMETAVPEYANPQHGAYAVPSLESGDAYNDEFGWSVRSLRPSAVEVPSAQRLGSIPRRDYRPDPVRPPQEFWDKLGADLMGRHTVEKIDADGWTESKGITASDRRWAPNPRSVPVPESRPTQQMAPTQYSFWRPFDNYSKRTFNGMHFSMADHRREYPILGMNPVVSRRNTYRLEPEPWDTNIVDVAPTAPMPQARVESAEIPFGPRTWRI